MDDQGPKETPPDETPEAIVPPPAASGTPEPVAPTEPPAASPTKADGITKIDLSALAGFSFGTQWTGGEDRRGGRGQSDQSERGGAGDDRGRGGEFRRDRRQARRPAGPGEGGGPSQQAPAQEGQRSPYRGDRPFPPRPAGERPRGGDFRPRPEGGGPPPADRGPRDRYPSSDRGPRGEGGGRFERGGRMAPQEMRPYLSPFFDVAFYAEDTAFSALVKAVRASCHTYELFEIARVVLAKPERFVVVVGRKPDGAGKTPPLFVTPVDSLPFENEDEAVQHVLRNHLDKFFTISEAEVEPPKGSFQFVCRCGFTGELLGPPNYHRYQHILQQHHASKLANMPFERFRDRIETVKDPEVVNQWLEKMKKTVRFAWKESPDPAQPLTFDSLEEARTYLLAHARDKVVRSHDSARFHGKGGEQMPAGEIRAAIEGHLERQRRFPLDTANALRGRLRREGFTIFKRGSKGVSYVCAVKRKFRLPGQVFSDSITGLIAFLEQHPLVSVKELPEKHLGIKQPEGAVAASSAALPAEAVASATVAPEDAVRLKRLWMDLRWLVTEGYVTEYSDGKLFAAPPLTPQQQKSEEAANAAADAVEDAARGATGEPPAAEAEPAAEPFAPEPPPPPASETAPAPLPPVEEPPPAAEPPAPVA